MDKRGREYRRKRKVILNTQSVCALCGRPVDMELKPPDPMAPTVDHIIPINRGGSNAMNNLQLAHWICNRMKSDKMVDSIGMKERATGKCIRVSCDWKNF